MVPWIVVVSLSDEMIHADPFIEQILARIPRYFTTKSRFGQCQYEHPETYYGAGDSLPCGRDAVGSDIESERLRCRTHLGN